MVRPFRFSRLHRAPMSGRTTALLAGVMAVGIAFAVRAEVKIEGTTSAVRVTTRNDAVADVLPALAAMFGFRYRTFVRLDAAANESYSGSLGEVIGRLLDGCSYVIKKDRDAFELVVVGGNGAPPAAVQAPAAEPGKTIVSQWR